MHALALFQRCFKPNRTHSLALRMWSVMKEWRDNPNRVTWRQKWDANTLMYSMNWAANATTATKHFAFLFRFAVVCICSNVKCFLSLSKITHFSSQRFFCSLLLLLFLTNTLIAANRSLFETPNFEISIHVYEQCLIHCIIMTAQTKVETKSRWRIFRFLAKQ